MARVAAAARRHGRVARVAIRVNPGPDAQGGAMRMGGKPSPFGFDEEEMEAAIDAVEAEPSLDLVGLHLFAGTQGLVRRDGSSRSGPTACASPPGWRGGSGARLPRSTSAAPRHSVLHRRLPPGSGALREGIPARCAPVRGRPPARRRAGRAGAGATSPVRRALYVARVRAVKTSRRKRSSSRTGACTIISPASGNLGQVVKRDYSVVAVREVEARRRAARRGSCRPLCTPLDMLARAALLPDHAAGDGIAVLQSGPMR